VKREARYRLTACRWQRHKAAVLIFDLRPLPGGNAHARRIFDTLFAFHPLKSRRPLPSFPHPIPPPGVHLLVFTYLPLLLMDGIYAGVAHVSRYLADKNYRALKRYLAGSTTRTRAW